MIESEEPAASTGWPDYRAVWRWHFYAGLFCIPFVVLLSISGSIYLFKNEIDAWIDRPYDHLHVKGYPATAADQTSAGCERAGVIVQSLRAAAGSGFRRTCDREP